MSEPRTSNRYKPASAAIWKAARISSPVTRRLISQSCGQTLQFSRCPNASLPRCHNSPDRCNARYADSNSLSAISKCLAGDIFWRNRERYARGVERSGGCSSDGSLDVEREQNRAIFLFDLGRAREALNEFAVALDLTYLLTY